MFRRSTCIADFMGKRRPGFTVIELLVAFAVLGVLVAILLPAVGSAREASRMTQCRNNIRQVAMAVHNYADNFGHVPPRRFAYQHLLAAMDESGNRRTSPTVYVCPSDNELQAFQGEVSFAFNEGCGHQIKDYNGVLSELHSKSPMRLRDITDGLSNTSLLSEKLVPREIQSSAEADPANLRILWHRKLPNLTVTPAQYEQLVVESYQPSGLGFPNVRFGSQSNLQLEYGYNHDLVPGSMSWHFLDEDYSVFRPMDSFISATSHHRDLVNVAACDGSVHAVSESIDGSVWAALGTRNGAEAIGTFEGVLK